MKASVYTTYGPPEVLAYRDVPEPVLADDEVLVEVYGSSLNFRDVALLKGKPYVARLSSGLRKPKHTILGGDVAGRVVDVGSKVTHFRTGDDVFADNGRHGFGAFAEYVAVPEESLVPKPANTSYEEAAAAPQAAVVALQGLRDKGDIQAGKKVLVNGASGGIGTFAVQIAKEFGAEVTGVCSTANLDLVRALGADNVIDYTEEDFTQNEQRYDLIFDIVANRSISAYVNALTPDGVYVACAFNPSSLFMGPFLSAGSNRRIVSLVHKPKTEDLSLIGEMLEARTLIPVVDRCYPLDELAEAVRYYETGNVRGKVVITA